MVASHLLKWVHHQQDVRGRDLELRYFFFFQAEDGIRDYKVTGVQTCALPISEIELAPSVPVIFCSGSISEKKGAALIRGGAKAFLHKPYSAHELTDVVRQILQPDPNH